MPVAQSSPSSAPWARDLGLLYLEDLEDPRAAIAWLERARSEPPQMDELAPLARARLQSGDASSARRILEPISRGELRWDEEVRLPLALALLRSGGEARTGASELIATAPKSLRETRSWHLARAEELASSAAPGEREQAASHLREAERILDLERRFRAARAQIASLTWPEARGPLLDAARLRFDAGDRPAAIRLARLASAADPTAVEPNQLLVQLLLDPAESFWRLEAIRGWSRALPADSEAKRREEETRKLFEVWR
jgi:hypothetical protein